MITIPAIKAAQERFEELTGRRLAPHIAKAVLEAAEAASWQPIHEAAPGERMVWYFPTDRAVMIGTIPDGEAYGAAQRLGIRVRVVPQPPEQDR